MLKQIDTKDDLEVLAKFLFGVIVNCCLLNEIPRRLLKVVQFSTQVLGGYLRWLNAAPEPDDEVALSFFTQFYTVEQWLCLQNAELILRIFCQRYLIPLVQVDFRPLLQSDEYWIR